MSPSITRGAARAVRTTGSSGARRRRGPAGHHLGGTGVGLDDAHPRQAHRGDDEHDPGPARQRERLHGDAEHPDTLQDEVATLPDPPVLLPRQRRRRHHVRFGGGAARRRTGQPANVASSAGDPGIRGRWSHPARHAAPGGRRGQEPRGPCRRRPGTPLTPGDPVRLRSSQRRPQSLRLLLAASLLGGGALAIPHASAAERRRRGALRQERRRLGDPGRDPSRPDFDAANQPVILTYSPYNSLGEPAPLTDSVGSRYVPKGYARAFADVLGHPRVHRLLGLRRQGRDPVRCRRGQVPRRQDRRRQGRDAGLVQRQGRHDRRVLRGHHRQHGRRRPAIPELAAVVPVAAISHWYGYAYYARRPLRRQQRLADRRGHRHAARLRLRLRQDGHRRPARAVLRRRRRVARRRVRGRRRTPARPTAGRPTTDPSGRSATTR